MPNVLLANQALVSLIHKKHFFLPKKEASLCVSLTPEINAFSSLLIYGEEGGQHRVCLFFYASFSTMRERLKRRREEGEREREEEKKVLPPLSLFSLSLSAPPFSSFPSGSFSLSSLPCSILIFWDCKFVFSRNYISFNDSSGPANPCIASHLIFTAHTSISNSQG